MLIEGRPPVNKSLHSFQLSVLVCYVPFGVYCLA